MQALWFHVLDKVDTLSYGGMGAMPPVPAFTSSYSFRENTFREIKFFHWFPKYTYSLQNISVLRYEGTIVIFWSREASQTNYIYMYQASQAGQSPVHNYSTFTLSQSLIRNSCTESMPFNLWRFLYNYFLLRPWLPNFKYSKRIFTRSGLKQVPWQLHARLQSYSHFFIDQLNMNVL